MENAQEPFEGWCLLELMGHRRIAGFISEASIAGGSFVRIDVPGDSRSAPATQFYAPGSIYAITPITEELARRFAERARPAPVSEYDLPPRPMLARVEGEDELDEETDQ
jgi:hypothetical protein